MKVNVCLYCGHDVLHLITHRSDGNNILECARCGIMMVENISDDTKSLYTAEYFQKDEGNKYGYTDYLSSPVANLIGKFGLARLFVDKGRHLDLGCADGSLMELFKAGGFDTKGFEISQDAVEIAKGKGLDVRQSNLDGFPALGMKFDVITAFDLLEHVDKPGVVLKEIHANLADDGYFVFSTLSVRKNDPSDYWFNNSLEHYIYYNQKNLAFVLGETFGKNNFAFTEIENNGIAEFWGFARKKKSSADARIVADIQKGSFDQQNPKQSYFLSLFYNQVSRFKESQKIIDFFKDTWTPSQYYRARFYNQYFQGGFENALEVAGKSKQLIPLSDSVFWQALADVESKFSQVKQIEQKEQIEQKDKRIFNLTEELSHLKNSRLLRRAIKLREAAGRVRSGAVGRAVLSVRDIKKAPRAALHKVRVVGAPLIPAHIRKPLKRRLIAYRDQLRAARVRTVVRNNKVWPEDRPLVSVVIPYFNMGTTVDDTLKSLMWQTFKNFEVVLVNDGSTDPKSVEKLQTLDYPDLRLKIVSQENKGVAVARNKGASQARGKYIMCLDSDDMLDPTFIEKGVIVLETKPDIALFTTNMQMFGVKEDVITYAPYDPQGLFNNNSVITAGLFRAEAWHTSNGYRSGIGYEDWDFWLKLAEHGFWGIRLPETLFRYRTAAASRYLEDRDAHWNNIELIRSFHPGYKKKIRKLQQKRKNTKELISTDSAFINLYTERAGFKSPVAKKPRVLITVPWMTFGGAETLIYNFCREIKDDYGISFVTGLESDHEWEYRFKEITPNIYHMANLFEDKKLYLEFVSFYIKSRNIDILHIIHNGFTFEMLAELKKRHPKLKVVLTIFNDRVEYFQQSVSYQEYIDMFTTDNEAVAKHYHKLLKDNAQVRIIPNGIDCYNEFSQTRFNRQAERDQLGLGKDDLAVFFVGRLSVEKNPDVFVRVARQSLAKDNLKRLRFFVVGDGPMRPQLEKMIEAVKSDRIQYLGYKTSSEVARSLSAADIFVLPSAIEGFPLSILEAMAMEVVVVASDVGAVSEVVAPEEGFVVPAGSAEAIGKSLEILAQDKKLLATMKEHSRAKIEKQYSNRVLGKNYRALYKDNLKKET